MQFYPWQMSSPVEAVVFDCDSTLSNVEGITVLSELNDVYPEVHALTEKAMAETGITLDLYAQRLDLVRPTASQLKEVERAYWAHVTPDIVEVIKCFQALGKDIHVASAGIQQPVEEFAAKLGIAEDHVHAVPVYFDAEGNYQGFDQESKFARHNGKSFLAQQLHKKYKTIAHVGDGMNDVEAASSVDRFIGYGGSCFRESIMEHSEFYIKCAPMAPLMPLLLTQEEAQNLSAEDKMLYERGCKMIDAGNVVCKMHV